MTEKLYALIHNAETGKTTIRELTTEEIEQLPTQALPTQEETPTE